MNTQYLIFYLVVAVVYTLISLAIGLKSLKKKMNDPSLSMVMGIGLAMPQVQKIRKQLMHPLTILCIGIIVILISPATFPVFLFFDAKQLFTRKKRNNPSEYSSDDFLKKEGVFPAEETEFKAPDDEDYTEVDKMNSETVNTITKGTCTHIGDGKKTICSIVDEELTEADGYIWKEGPFGEVDCARCIELHILKQNPNEQPGSSE